MMKKAFINPLGVLTAWGYVESNGSNTSVSVDDDFSLEPGKWKLTEGAWIAWPITPPTPLQEIRAIESRPDVADAMARASRQFLLKTWFDRAKAMPAAASFTDAQIEAWCRANDKTYKSLAEAEETIRPLRALIV